MLIGSASLELTFINTSRGRSYTMQRPVRMKPNELTWVSVTYCRTSKATSQYVHFSNIPAPFEAFGRREVFSRRAWKKLEGVGVKQ